MFLTLCSGFPLVGGMGALPPPPRLPHPITSLLIFFILALHFALIVKVFFVHFVNIESEHK